MDKVQWIPAIHSLAICRFAYSQIFLEINPFMSGVFVNLWVWHVTLTRAHPTSYTFFSIFLHFNCYAIYA